MFSGAINFEIEIVLSLFQSFFYSIERALSFMADLKDIYKYNIMIFGY